MTVPRDAQHIPVRRHGAGRPRSARGAGLGRFVLLTGVSAALGLASAFAVVALQPAGGDAVVGTVRADELADKLAELKKVAKSKDGADRTRALIKELADEENDAVAKVLLELTKSKKDAVAIAAVEDCARRLLPDYQKKLKKHLGDKKLIKDRPDVFKAVLTAAGAYADPKLGGPLADVVKKFLPTNGAYAGTAIRSYGTVRDLKVVDQIVKWLQMTETTNDKMSDQQRQAYATSKTAAVTTLRDLTGIDIGDGKKWKEFWEKKRKGFEFPDPDAPPLDWSTLREWSDVANGYTIKLPDGEEWGFDDPTSGGDELRAKVFLQTSDGDRWGTVEARQSNLTRGSLNTVEAFADWYANEFKENQFSMLKGDAATIEEKKIGGREYTVVRAVGDSKGNWGSWGAREVRVYLTQVDHILMRFEVTVRLAAEPEVKSSLFDVVPGLAWE